MSPPSTLAHYRLTVKLGEGGMGAVYRATDTKLNRDVAIKVLPDSFAADPERLARFTREAKVLASLNHPNIAAIYGVEERALVLELVEGPTLAERIGRGALDAEQALPLIQQLIDALEYAHQKGIVHRDLKPANLKLTPDGRLKVLDFGLAKALAGDAVTAPASAPSSTTLTIGATMAGAIMGTPGYMSPEQARGQEVDERADIWAFGVVVYEMLTGRRLFDGSTVSDAMAAVLRQELNFGAVPARFRRLMRWCLERDPRRRLRDIGDARLQLEEETPAVAASAPARGSKFGWIAAAVAGVAAVVLGGLLWSGGRGVERPLMRFETQLSPDAVGAAGQTAVLSPDGQRVAFRVRTNDGYLLGVRALAETAVVTLPGTENVSQFAFSKDGRWLAFFARGNLLKTSVQGGTPSLLCESPQPAGATWLSDGSIVSSTADWGVTLAHPGGGSCQPLLEGLFGNRASLLVRWPQALPGDETILFTTGSLGLMDWENANIEAISMKTGTRKTLVRGGYFGRYAPTGHLLYVHKEVLYGVRFDASRLETAGSPVAMVQGVRGSPSAGGGQFDFSNTGTLLYATGPASTGGPALAVFNQEGKQESLGGLSGTSLRLSPDGARLAFSNNGDLSVYRFVGKAETRITFDATASNRHPVWTPDGRYLAFTGKKGIWWTRSDGSGQPVRLIEGDPTPTPWSVAEESPKRLRLAFHRSGEGGNRSILTVMLDLKDADHPVVGTPELFLGSTENEVEPAFSPDGRWLAYTIDAGGETGIYVRRFRAGKRANESGKFLVSGGRVRFPVWSRGRSEILFRSPGGYIMAADYTATDESFVVGKPRRWSEKPIYITNVFQDFDLMPDGKRAAVVSLPYDTSPPMVFVVNFFDELKRRIP